MSKFEKVLKVVGVIIGVVLVGVLLGWWGGRGHPAPLPPAPEASHSSGVQATKHTNAPSSLLAKIDKSRPRPRPGASEASGTGAPLPANVITNWEDKLDTILSTEGSDTDKAKQMLEMFPRLPEEGQAEVAQHLSNLTPDENYSPLGQYLTNSTLSETVLDVLLADLLNRPNSVKLPMLYEIARQGEQNAKAGDAKDILQLYLDEDYGEDWTQWQTKMDQWLKDNPD